MSCKRQASKLREPKTWPKQRTCSITSCECVCQRASCTTSGEFQVRGSIAPCESQDLLLNSFLIGLAHAWKSDFLSSRHHVNRRHLIQMTCLKPLVAFVARRRGRTVCTRPCWRTGSSSVFSNSLTTSNEGAAFPHLRLYQAPTNLIVDEECSVHLCVDSTAKETKLASLASHILAMRFIPLGNHLDKG